MTVWKQKILRKKKFRNGRTFLKITEKHFVKSTKPKTRNQIIKWLKKSSFRQCGIYDVGNGVALPCVFYVLNGIAHYAELTNSVI